MNYKNMFQVKKSIDKLWEERLSHFFSNLFFPSRWVIPYHNNNEAGRVTVNVGSVGYRDDHIGDVFMFVQDMYQGIMPYTRMQTDGPQFTARIEPENEHLENLIINSLDRRGYRHQLTDTISNFIIEAAHSIFIYGLVAYEIVYETNAYGKVNRFEFVTIYPPSVKKIFGNFFQVIPWRVARQLHVKTGLRKIPKHKILYIEFPKRLGGKKTLKKILKRLAKLSKELVPKFHMEAMEKNQNIGFDLNMYVREKYIEKGQLTKEFGWHQRKIPDNEILEYYSIHRRLKFALSQAVVREHIVSKINELLKGPLFNTDGKIIMEKILTSDQIMSELELLQKGPIEFTTLYKRTSQI